MAVTFLTDLDEFFGNIIQSQITISIIREYVFGKIDNYRINPEFNEFEEICV